MECRYGAPFLLNLIIAEENEIIRFGMKNALEETEGVDVIGEYASVDDMMSALSRLKPDVVILGGNIDFHARCQACNDVRDVSAGTRVITLFEKYQDDELREIILSGASGCVLTSAGKAGIIKSVGIVANGGLSFDNDALIRILGQAPKLRPNAGSTEIDALTERQTLVLSLIAQGYKNRDIAERLNISNSTVKSDIARIKDKLALDSRAQLAAYAERRGILDDLN